MRHSPNGETSHEANAGGENQQIDRIPANDLAGFANCTFQVMLFDIRSGPVECICRTLREVFDRFRTLPSTLANGGGSGMKVASRLVGEVIDLLRYPGRF
jgi:hypothetical protein